MNNIEVSVIVPVYNEELYIEAFIQSLINQTFPREKSEWIIIDGASTDKTKEILLKYADEYPIKILDNPDRKTPISLNIGIENSAGDYIVRLDAHAFFPPDYIEKCIERLKTTDADNVGGRVVTKGKGVMGSAIAKMLSSSFGVGDSAFRLEGKSGYVDTVPFGAFRRSVFEKVGNFNETLLRSEDNDMNSRIIASGGKIFLADDIYSEYYCRDSVPKILKMGIQNGNALFRTILVNKNAMKLRHFIPFAFFVSVIGLGILSLFFSFFKWLFLAEAVLYLLCDIFFSFSKKNVKYFYILIWLYPLFHLSYGLGSALGLFGITLY